MYGRALPVLTGASIHEPRKRHIPYRQMVIWYIYNTTWPGNPHSQICLYKWCPRGPSLVGPITCNPGWARPGFTLCLRLHLPSPHHRWRHNHHKHSADASRALPRMCQVHDTSAVIGICSFALATVSAFFWLIVSDSIRLAVSDLIRLPVFYWIIISFLILFYSCLMYLFLIRLTLFESYSSPDSGNPTLARVSYKELNTKIKNYSMILRTQIGFGENWYKPRDNDRINSIIAIRSLLSLTKRL